MFPTISALVDMIPFKDDIHSGVLGLCRDGSIDVAGQRVLKMCIILRLNQNSPYTKIFKITFK